MPAAFLLDVCLLIAALWTRVWFSKTNFTSLRMTAILNNNSHVFVQCDDLHTAFFTIIAFR